MSSVESRRGEPEEDGEADNWSGIVDVSFCDEMLRFKKEMSDYCYYIRPCEIGVYEDGSNAGAFGASHRYGEASLEKTGVGITSRL
jgi:hypothetical protein